jgi:hypothetical protein
LDDPKTKQLRDLIREMTKLQEDTKTLLDELTEQLRKSIEATEARTERRKKSRS